ncbi:glycosyltransferase [Ramlibacter sp.]|uniref:glycosyltransferase n=1 Tax=Ramlibacter sp. TaxID=1917967 RepID=UPI002C5CBFCC|nr:glycosyltransferase [Ramlibacter sp.]HWI84516.1 glycosyltransferase [Ramlibacter sp.]
MRILFILHQFFPEFGSGTERVALNIARMAQRAGHHVHVLAGTVDPARTGGAPTSRPFAGCIRLSHEGIAVTLIPRNLLPATADIGLDADEALAGPLAQWMQAERFDIAHVLHTMRMATAVLAAQRCGLPYVATLTDFFVPCARINLVTQDGEGCGGPDRGRRCPADCPAPPWTTQSYLRRYDQGASLLAGAAERVVPSEFVAQRYRASYPELSFRVIPHGIDLLALVRHGGERSRPRPRQHPLRLAFVGTVVPQKGLHVLLRAARLLQGRDLSLKVIGAFHGNPGYHQEVRALASGDSRVEITGAMSAADLFAALQEIDLLCLPSQVPETFSLILQESAAAGVPALVSDLGAPADRVAEQGSGRVVPHADPQAWAAAIAAVLDDPALLPQWRSALPLPLRIEEEAFFYESLFRRNRRLPA